MAKNAQAGSFYFTAKSRIPVKVLAINPSGARAEYLHPDYGWQSIHIEPGYLLSPSDKEFTPGIKTSPIEEKKTKGVVAFVPGCDTAVKGLMTGTRFHVYRCYKERHQLKTSYPISDIDRSAQKVGDKK